jgi:hypothetical protein
MVRTVKTSAPKDAGDVEQSGSTKKRPRSSDKPPKATRDGVEQDQMLEEEADEDYDLPSVEEWGTFKSYKTCQRRPSS